MLMMLLCSIYSILFILAIKYFSLLHSTDLLVHGAIIDPNLLIQNAIARDWLALTQLTKIRMLLIHFSQRGMATTTYLIVMII